MLIDHDLPLAAEIDKLGRPKKKRTSPERVAQQAVVAWLRRVLPPGSKVAAIVNEQAGSAKTKLQRARFGQARRKSGVLTAMPDLVCVLPAGRTVWIEMKAPEDGVVRVSQDDLHKDFAGLGHQVGIATCIDTARYVLRQAGVHLRESAGEPARPAKVRVERKPRLPADPVPF